MSWRCRLCETEFESIDGFIAVNVPPSHSGFRLYWTADRRLIHEVRAVRAVNQESVTTGAVETQTQEEV